MTVAQLITRLTLLDPAAEVWVENAETGQGPATEFIPNWGRDGQVMIR